MSTEPTEDKPTRIECEFCGCGQRDCKYIVAGPKCYICDSCVMMAVGVIGNRELFDRWNAAKQRADKAEAKLASTEKVYPMGNQFLAYDGYCEREEFDSLPEARVWAQTQLDGERDVARADGVWDDSAERITIWMAVEQTREFEVEDGIDFVLEPCVSLADTPRPAPRDEK